MSLDLLRTAPPLYWAKLPPGTCSIASSWQAKTKHHQLHQQQWGASGRPMAAVISNSAAASARKFSGCFSSYSRIGGNSSHGHICVNGCSRYTAWNKQVPLGSPEQTASLPTIWNPALIRPGWAVPAIFATPFLFFWSWNQGSSSFLKAAFWWASFCLPSNWNHRAWKKWLQGSPLQRFLSSGFQATPA